MKKKDEVLSRFVEFKALVENQTSNKIKAFRSDNKGEYISNTFKDLCAKEGIKRELTAPIILSIIGWMSARIAT
jgi:hypothetical protein